MRRCLGLAAGILTLAGCAAGVPVERELVVSGARFQAVQGEASLVVRTHLRDAAGARREVVGADCDLVASLYAAEFTTPTRLVLPNFGPQSPQLTVSCRAGDLSGAARTTIVTRWQDFPGYRGYPGPLYGPPGWGLWGGWGWSGPAFAISDYPDISVELR